MKTKPLFTLALLMMAAGGCASDPSFNLLPPPLYQRGSLERPIARQLASVESSPQMDSGAYYAPGTGGASFSRQVTPF